MSSQNTNIKSHIGYLNYIVDRIENISYIRKPEIC